MAIAPVFGLQFIRPDDQSLPVLASNMDVVGIVGPCNTADPSIFPLNTPVLVLSNDTPTLTKLYDPVSGLTDGYIVDAINAINGQLADFQISAQIVIVRTDYGTATDPALKLMQTIANIMGNSVLRTGVWAFMKAPSMLYCTPRLIMAPGYTGVMANSLDTLHTVINGSGYIPNASYAVTFAFGAGEINQAEAVLPTAHALADPNGNINNASMFIDSFGAWMTVAPTATIVAHDGPPTPAVAATGQIVFSTIPSIGNTITLNSTVWSFIAHGATPSGNQIALGLDLATTLTAIQTALNASVETQTSKCTYTISLSGLYLSIVIDIAGAAGNSYTIATNVSGATISGSHLLGGADAIIPSNATLVATIALGANPVVAAMTGGLLDGLMAHAVVESTGTSLIADENWRDTISSARIIALSGGVKVADPVSGLPIIMPFAPRFIGLLIARDFSTGYPFHSAANQPINGILGPARTIEFNLTDGSVEGQLLLGANIGIIARGLIGVETAIAQGGFVCIATDTCSDNLLWQFYNQTRGRDFIELSLMPTLRTYLGKENIDRQTVTEVIDSIRNFLSQLTALQQILGYSVSFQGSLNSVDEIRLGHITVSFAAEEPPVLRRITTMSSRYRPAIDALIANLAATLNFSGVA